MLILQIISAVPTPTPTAKPTGTYKLLYLLSILVIIIYFFNGESTARSTLAMTANPTTGY